MTPDITDLTDFYQDAGSYDQAVAFAYGCTFLVFAGLVVYILLKRRQLKEDLSKMEQLQSAPKDQG